MWRKSERLQLLVKWLEIIQLLWMRELLLLLVEY
jgi:hypothetical protein